MAISPAIDSRVSVSYLLLRRDDYSCQHTKSNHAQAHTNSDANTNPYSHTHTHTHRYANRSRRDHTAPT